MRPTDCCPMLQRFLNVTRGIGDRATCFLNVTPGTFGGFTGSQGQQDEAEDNGPYHGNLRSFLRGYKPAFQRWYKTQFQGHHIGLGIRMRRVARWGRRRMATPSEELTAMRY